MIKKTLLFENPAHLSTKHDQLIIRKKEDTDRTIPIEDIGVILLDHYGISISQPLLGKLMENNTVVITTDTKHMPNGLLLPISGNSTQSESIRNQLAVSVPLKKQLWKQTVEAKIKNQKILLDQQGIESKTLKRLVEKVRSGDPDNFEGQAAKYYWPRLFSPFTFNRKRFGDPPNNLLNYGYAILRSVITRSIVSSGLLPNIGIHHRNKYNAFPLADDIMEPYRPFVDELVLNILFRDESVEELTTELKKELLSIPHLSVKMKSETRPLMIAASRTTASLDRCFKREQKIIHYPEIWN